MARTCACVRGRATLRLTRSRNIIRLFWRCRMDPVCLVMPILPGKTDDARAFLQELEGPRKPEFDLSERRIGISKELWYLATLPSGDQLVGYMEAANFGEA